MSVKVSVLLITYNQQEYIRKAIESILSQKTSFSWELLIGEDSSKDNTAEIIKQSISNKPDNCTVHSFFRKENIGASKNLFDLIKNAKGEYITVLEGDDYWLEESRLQELSDFLDEHKNFVGVSYKRERRQEGNLIAYDPDESIVGKSFSLREYCGGKRFSAMACMFQNFYFQDLKGYEYLFTGARNACDQIMCYTILSQGDIFILDKVFGVYRVFSGGYCTQQNVINRANDYLIQNRRILEYYGETKEVLNEIGNVHATIMKALLSQDGFLSMIRYFIKIRKIEKKRMLCAVIGKISKKFSKRRT